ncbi:MAG: helix-turn-helix transcriptional regulator [Hyphomicrobiales bacterium]|nr:helix-turn-helix transcriptional regulator [Hyphomicrobiales bacterium]
MLKNAYRCVLSGDGLERAVHDNGILAAAISADHQRFVCSPALVDWIAKQYDISESTFKNTVMAVVRKGATSALFPRFGLEIGWRNVASHSQCAITCIVAPKQPQVFEDRPILTPRERQIVALIARGMTDREISDNLGIAFWTVRTHVGNGLRKFNARNRVGLTGVRSGSDESSPV